MPEETKNAIKGGATNDEVALELTKFIAQTTGYGRGGGSNAGFGRDRQPKSPEEYADALIELFERCRSVVNKQAT